jgi:hypothetical protein
MSTEYQWKVNPNKCIFGAPLGKLLGFINSHRDIEADPKMISAITNMQPASNLYQGCPKADRVYGGPE